MWGTWWDWDPRLTTELILLFLYLGVIGLYHAIEDRRSAARAAGLLAIVGVGLLPIIRYSVDWWGALHQRQSINVFGENAVRPELIAPLWWMVVATKLWFVGSLLAKARADNIAREAGKAWIGERFGTADGEARR
jgi:heme exporter protein C